MKVQSTVMQNIYEYTISLNQFKYVNFTDFLSFLFTLKQLILFKKGQHRIQLNYR